MMNRRTLSLALACALSLSLLTACGGKGNDASTSGSGDLSGSVSGSVSSSADSSLPDGSTPDQSQPDGSAPDAAQPEQKLNFAVQLLAQCAVSRTQSVTLIEDAYAIGAAFTPQWADVALESRLDAQTLRQTLRDTLRGEVQSVADCAAYLGLPVQTRTQGGVQLEVPAFVNLLYYDREDALQGASARLSAQSDVALAQEGQCIVQPALLPDTYAAPAPDGAEVRCECQLFVQCFSAGTLRTLCGGTLEAEPRPASRPAVIVRRAERTAALWELAKAYGACADAIRSANDLTGVEVTAGQIVLIPM